MKLKHDRQIVISVGKSRKDMNWLPQTMTVSELYARFDNPVRGVETLVNYLKLKKSQQDDLKDVGGFVGGSLSGGRRKASAVTGRDLITLDFDTIPAYGAPAILSTLDGLGCSYLVYSTRKHCETAPRLRILMPLDRTVTAEEYEAIARRIASMIGIQMADPTTFEPSRLMYWPSCCADSEYICKHKDAQFVSADSVLGTYTEETRSLWHEIQKYLNLIHTLVNGGENQEAVRCMAEVTTIFNGITVNVDVGNSIISGILSVGLQQAKQKNIPFNIDAWVASDLGIEPQDLLIILGNAIDNAIEECAQIFPERDRYINVLIHQKEKILVIKVENPCRSTPTPKPGKIHGYGLKNVKRCVDKYNGELQVKSQNGEFCFFVLLNIQQ